MTIFMTTYPSQTKIAVPDMSEDDIVIEDIAHSLSMLCRYNGYTPTFYSVAEHCCRAYEIYSREYQHLVPFVSRQRVGTAVLMHDAAEAYMGDLVTAWKYNTTIGDEFRIHEAKVDELLATKFQYGGLADELKYVVKLADESALDWEAAWILNGTLGGWPPHHAAKKFLEIFEEVIW